MRTRHQHGPAARGRAAVFVAVLDLVIVAVVAAHLAGGTVTGATEDPVRLLGTTLAPTGCPTVPLAVGSGTTVVCPEWMAITSPANVVEVVSVFGPGNSVVDEYGGALPQGLTWGESVQDVWAALGRPNHITGVYGTPTMVYMYGAQPYGSLELRFDAAEHLIRVNASLVH